MTREDELLVLAPLRVEAIALRLGARGVRVVRTGMGATAATRAAGRAAAIPAARSSGIAVGESNESSLTCGQRARTCARVASSVQSATTTSASGARRASASRHWPR